MRKIDRKVNMQKANLLAENLYIKSKIQLNEETNQILTFDTLPECVKSNFEKNITVSVAFIKKDGSVRHMAFRRNLKSYKKSETEKTEKQMNYLQNNNLMNVYDTNSFIRNKRENMAAGMDEEQAAEEASKKSFRNFKLENVMGFLCGGSFYDMRERNNIAQRFGEETAAQLTKSMIAKMQSDESSINEELNAPNVIGQQGKDELIGRLMQKLESLKAERANLTKQIEALSKEIKIKQKELSPNQTSLF